MGNYYQLGIILIISDLVEIIGENRMFIAYVVIIIWIYHYDSELNHLYESKWGIDVFITYR